MVTDVVPCDGSAVIQLVGMLGDRWSVPVLVALGDRGRLRRAELWRAVGEVSQKVLTACLRRLETHGFVHRVVETTPTVAVSYELSELGRSFSAAFEVLRRWARENVDRIGPPGHG